MDKKIIIKSVDEETLEFYVDDKQVGFANHDEHGWSGMDATKSLVRNMAKALGIKVIYKEE